MHSLSFPDPKDFVTIRSQHFSVNKIQETEQEKQKENKIENS